MADLREDDHFAAALLRVAIALQRDPSADLDTLIARTAAAMKLDEETLRVHVAKNFATVRAAGAGVARAAGSRRR